MNQTQIDSLVVTLGLDSSDFTSKIKGVDRLIDGLTNSLDGLQESLDKVYELMSLFNKIGASMNGSLAGSKQSLDDAGSKFEGFSSKISLATNDLKTFSDTAKAISEQKIKLNLGVVKPDWSDLSSGNNSNQNNPLPASDNVATLLAQIAKYTMFTANEVKLANDYTARNMGRTEEEAKQERIERTTADTKAGVSRGEIAGWIGYGKILDAILSNRENQIQKGGETALEANTNEIPANTLSAWNQISEQTNLNKNANMAGLFGNVRNSQFQALFHKQFTPFMNLLQRLQINPVNVETGQMQDPEELLFRVSERLQEQFTDVNTRFQLANEATGDPNAARLLSSVKNLRGGVGLFKQTTALSNPEAQTMLQIQESKTQLSQTIDSLIREVTGGFTAELQFFQTLNSAFSYFNEKFAHGVGAGLTSIGNDVLDSKPINAIGGFERYLGSFSSLGDFGQALKSGANALWQEGLSNPTVPAIVPNGALTTLPPIYNAADQTRAIMLSGGQDYNRSNTSGNNGTSQQININNVNINTPSIDPVNHASEFKRNMEGLSLVGANATGMQ